ncbi:MAG TPA: hypothetical protein VFV95_15380 [Vicinamibacterales bacterium]|nr:hypothetical protein [Vicinamibacterales bacterium]
MLGLLALGALAVAWHVFVRGRLRLGPGHQGLVWMALVMIGRMNSRLPWAAVTTAAGAAGATMLPMWRLGDPFLWVSYMAAGAIVDLGFGSFLRSSRVLWAIALLGGVAHAVKPLIRSVIQLGGWHYESLVSGVPYPASTHFLFGAAGALIGASVIKGWQWRRKAKEVAVDERSDA